MARTSLRLACLSVLAAACTALAGSIDASEPAAAADARAAAGLVDDFVYGSLALAPVAATAAGYHRHGDADLDPALDDYSAAGLARSLEFSRSLARRLAVIHRQSLDAEQRADLAIVSDGVQLALLELTRLQSYRHNPTVYVELVGNAIYTPYVLDYAPAGQRYRHIIARLQQVPRLMVQARANLLDSPAIWNEVAREENAGNIDLIEHTLRVAMPENLRADYDLAAGPALGALRAFNDWLERSLSRRTSDWRLGADNYARKCALVLHVGKTPAELLSAAEADLKAVQEKMAGLAAPESVRQALAQIAEHHAARDGYLQAARAALAGATEFVRERGLLTLPAGSNLSVIETPVFMRGIYGVGGFNAAPALQPELGAYYWVTPIDPSWPEQRAESKLREYNDYGLQHLTIHEAMPGHYVQLEYANQLADKSRRVLRALWGNGPYVEGWAFYTQQMMVDEGYLNNAPALRMTLYKQELRGIANTILDIRLQTMGMSDEQALALMTEQTYQEREEALAKLQRAKLSSCQLAMYYSGWKAWLATRERFRERRGAAYSLREFHERALRESAVPMPVLDQLLK